MAAVRQEGTIPPEVSGTTKTASFVTSPPDAIAQDVPHDRDHSLDKLLAYCRRNWGRVRKVGQKKSDTPPTESTSQQTPGPDAIPNGVALETNRQTITQEHSDEPTVDSNRYLNSQSSGLGSGSRPNVEPEIDILPENTNAVSGSRILRTESLLLANLPQIPEVPKGMEHEQLASISETIDSSVANSGPVSHDAISNALQIPATKPYLRKQRSKTR
ncbi:hypothetical protein ACEPPN_014747 [Leptodophora sp. 'Broadleaf-Isolate-01']